MSDDPAGDVTWTGLDLDELVDAYWEVVAPAMREAGLDPTTDRPTHAWLSDRGFRGLVYALRTYHGRTFGEFWSEDLDLATGSGYDWGIEHGTTVSHLEAFLESRRDRADLRPSSVETLRYRLSTYAGAYRAENGTGDLLAPVAPDGDTPAHEATDAAWAAFDCLDAELAPRTVRRIHGAVDDWYAHLIRRRRAALNPVAGLEDEYRWSRRVADPDEATNPALADAHVRRLYASAGDTGDRLLVIALCAWGLRSGEVAALHRDQFVLDDAETEVPYVAFEDRKNGPGQVSILYGREVLGERLARLGPSTDYLFPSDRSSSGHITRQTVLNRFDGLVDRAGLPEAIEGRKPVPQMARRFWYDAYAATREALVSELGEIAAEQGSASAEVVLQDYLSPSRRRRLRRAHMRERLSSAFESTDA